MKDESPTSPPVGVKTAEEILKTKPSMGGEMNDVLFEYVDVCEAMEEYARRHRRFGGV